MLIAERVTTISDSPDAEGFGGASEYREKATPVVVTLSASRMEALEQTALDHASFLDSRLLGNHAKDATHSDSSNELIEFAKATQHQKTSQRYRLAIKADSNAAVVESLRAFAGGDSGAVLVGTAPTDREISVGIHFGGFPTGQSSSAKSIGSTKTLLRQRSRTFQDWAERCDMASRSNVDGPANAFSVSFALAKMFEAWGIKPTEITGHGVGERIAASFRGDVCWKEAVRNLASADGIEPSIVGRKWDTQPDAPHLNQCDVVLMLGQCDNGMKLGTSGGQTAVPISLLGRDVWSECLDAIGQLYVRGVQWNWDAVETLGIQNPRWILPGAPLDRQRHWIDERDSSSKMIPATKKNYRAGSFGSGGGIDRRANHSASIGRLFRIDATTRLRDQGRRLECSSNSQDRLASRRPNLSIKSSFEWASGLSARKDACQNVSLAD